MCAVHCNFNPSSLFLRECLYNEEHYTFGFLCPNYNGFLALMDEFFMEGGGGVVVQDKGKDTGGSAADYSGSKVLLVFDASNQEAILAKIEENKIKVIAQGNKDVENISRDGIN
jgi:hypothetical protein